MGSRRKGRGSLRDPVLFDQNLCPVGEIEPFDPLHAIGR
jgi:hypothetical protein